MLSAVALRLRSKAYPEPILVFDQRAIQDLTFNRGARVITGPALTDLDFNKEMAIFGNSDREIHKFFIFLLLVVISGCSVLQNSERFYRDHPQGPINWREYED